MPSIRITGRQVLAKRKYPLEYISYEQTDHEGKVIRQDREIYFRPNGASILLYDPERRKLLITKQFRLPVYLQGEKEPLMEACAGIIDEGESPEDAIVRETEEETGYVIGTPEKVAECYTSPAGNMEIIHLYAATYSPAMKESEGGGNKDEGEDIRLSEISFDEARELVLGGKIRDIKTLALFQHALIRGWI